MTVAVTMTLRLTAARLYIDREIFYREHILYRSVSVLMTVGVGDKRLHEREKDRVLDITREKGLTRAGSTHASPWHHHLSLSPTVSVVTDSAAPYWGFSHRCINHTVSQTRWPLASAQRVTNVRY